MSGPVTTDDAAATSEPVDARGPCVEILDSRRAEVGRFEVRRALPRRTRRSVGAWCFADHFGPADVTEDGGLDIGPHPHIGLQTVTWLIEGEVLHRDSLGSEQLIRPGQLNLMTAGAGVSHTEEATGGYRGPLQGIQLWVAQPDATRDGPPAFEHHGELPREEQPGCTITALVGEVAGLSSPARRDTEHMGAELDVHARATIPLSPTFEHAIVVLTGALAIDGAVVTPGHLAYLGAGRDELGLQPDGPTRALLIGGVPCTEPILMWWNFVARTRDEITAAHRDWTTRDARFGSVASPLAPMDTPPPPWADAPGDRRDG
jgi:redox-sensitive bicupin YhaK (pirin superfamily)